MKFSDKPCTLRDVAALAGVNSSAVSQVLNQGSGNTRVSEQTREKILRAARKLNYTPNETARTLRRGMSDNVGLICGDFRNPFFSELAAALESSLRQAGFTLSICHVAGLESDRRSEALEQMICQGFRSILIWSEAYENLSVKPGSESRRIDLGFTTKPAPGIWLNLENALQLAVGHLAQLGYSRLGYYSPRSSHESPSVQIRSAVFQLICAQAGLSEPQMAYYGGESWDISVAKATGREVLLKHQCVEAWVGFNDIASLGLLMASEEIKLSKKPSVFCIDGTILVRQWPTRPPVLDLGIHSIGNLIVQAIRDGLPAEPVVLEPRIIV